MFLVGLEEVKVTLFLEQAEQMPIGGIQHNLDGVVLVRGKL